MIKQAITYENFDGERVTEVHYFHLSKSELIDMELAGGKESLTEKLMTVGKSENGALIIKMFKEIIGAAYGERVDGSGSQFYKTPEISQRFLGSLAFDSFLGQLMTDPGLAVKFVNGIMPKDLMATAEVQAALEKAKDTTDIPLPGLPDPNNLDSPSGTWPSAGSTANRVSGLDHPWDVDGKQLPWAYREPTEQELMAMNTQQMAEVYKRKTSRWKPPPEAV